MRRAGSLSRTVALVALGSFAVHSLRFAIALASGALNEPQLRGQSLLGHLPVALAAVGFALIAARLWSSYTGAAPSRGAPASSIWRRSLGFGTAILAVYLAQATLELALFADHAPGALAALGQGVWVVAGLAFSLAPLCALLDVGIGRLETRVARLGRPPLPVAAAAQPRIGSPRAAFPRLSPLASGLAQRPPPRGC